MLEDIEEDVKEDLSESDLSDDAMDDKYDPLAKQKEGGGGNTRKMI